MSRVRPQRVRFQLRSFFQGIQGNVYMRNITLENWESCEVPIETYEISLVKNYESLKQHVFETIDFEVSATSKTCVIYYFIYRNLNRQQ